MTSLRRRLPLLAGTVLVAVAVGGCGAEPLPDQLAPPAALPSADTERPSKEVPEPAPATVPVAEPAEVPSSGDDGEPTPAEVAEIEQFIRDYYAAANAALESGNTASLATFSLAECNCRYMVDFIEKNHARGRIEGSRTTVVSIDVQEVGPEIASVVVDRVAPDGRIVGPDGETVAVIDNGEPGFGLHALARTDEGWKVMQVLDQ